MSPFNLMSAILVFCVTLGLLDWSEHYKVGYTSSIYVFLATITGVNLLFSYVNTYLPMKLKKPIEIQKIRRRTIKGLTIAIIAIFFVNLLYVRSFPLLELIRGGAYKELDSLPGFDTIFLSLVLCLIVYSLDATYTVRRSLLIGTVLSLILVSRITLVLILTLWILHVARGKLLKLSSYAFVLLILFGVLGELRSSNSKYAERAVQNDTSLTTFIMRPTDKFTNMGAPDVVLWPWVYMVSPIKNLDSAFSENRMNPKMDSVTRFILPNFIYSRLGVEKDKSFLVVDTFNTSTIYGELAANFGLIGVFIGHFILCIYSLMLFHIAKKIRSKNLYNFTALIFILSLFSNVIGKELIFFTGVISVFSYLYFLRLTK
jgi:hypothetical protein